MSGPIKAVQSVFKSVTKSPIGKIAVGAAVAYFTAGIGATVLGAVGATGMSATLTTVLSHAISGTIAGGLTSALTGDSIGKGLAFGGLGGAVMGGVQSALGSYTQLPGQAAATQSAGNVGPGSQPGQPAASGASAPVQNTGTMQPGAIGNAPSITGPPPAATPGMAAPFASPTPVNTGMLQPNQMTVFGAGSSPGGAQAPLYPYPTATTAGTAPSGGGILGFIKDNPAAAAIAGGGLVQGLGSGLMAKGTADAATETAQMKIDAEKEKQAAITASHTGTGLLQPGPLDQTPRPKPNDRFNPAAYSGKGSWVYDPTVGRIVWVAAA